MKSNIVFKLEKFERINDIDPGIKEELGIVMRAKDPGLLLTTLHQRSSSRGSVGHCLRRVVTVGQDFRVSIASMLGISLSHFKAGLLYLSGSWRQNGVADYGLLYCASVEDMDLQYFNLLTVIKAWSDHGAFSSRENIEVPEFLTSDDLPRWEEDPSYFVL